MGQFCPLRVRSCSCSPRPFLQSPVLAEPYSSPTLEHTHSRTLRTLPERGLHRVGWLVLLEAAGPLLEARRADTCRSLSPARLCALAVSTSLYSAHMLMRRPLPCGQGLGAVFVDPRRLSLYNTVCVSSPESYGISVLSAYLWTFGFGEDSPVHLVSLFMLCRWQFIPRQMK